MAQVTTSTPTHARNKCSKARKYKYQWDKDAGKSHPHEHRLITITEGYRCGV